MRIKIKRNWKDFVDQKPHQTFSRRDFLRNGLATGTATVLLPHALAAALARKAFGDQSSCPQQTRQQGAIAQIYRVGGATIGAMIQNSTQAGFMNSSAAANYGIVATDLVQVGKNWYVSKSSPFGMALMTAPAGLSQSTWNSILMNTSLGGHYGAFNADDAAGQNLGLNGSSALYKPSLLSKDLRIDSQSTLSPWSIGAPSTGVSGSTTKLTSTSIASNFSIMPSTNTNPQLMTNSATAADSLSQIFANLLGTAGKTNGTTALQKAVCGFYGDSVMADSNFGSSLFSATQISTLSSAFTLSSLSAEMQALLAAFYESATGSIGGVFIEQQGCDYHGQSVQTTISPSDIEAGQMVAMFLAACFAAQTKGALILSSNGQAIANGTQQVSATFQNTTLTVNGPVAQNDAGGSYNAGMILCYDPSSPPTLSSTGTFNTTNGNVAASPNVASVLDATAGLFLTAALHLGLPTNNIVSMMQEAGISIANISNSPLVLIS